MMGGGGQGHVADVGKQYPALSWHQGRECTTPEISRRPGHTQTGTKGRHTHIDICIHARTHTHRETHRDTHGGRYTQTTKRQIKDSLSVSATQQLL